MCRPWLSSANAQNPAGCPWSRPAPTSAHSHYLPFVNQTASWGLNAGCIEAVGHDVASAT